MERSQYADAEWSCSRSDPGADLVRPAGIGPTVGESDGAELCAALCAASRAVYMADIPGGQVWRCRGSIQEAVVRIDWYCQDFLTGLRTAEKIDSEGHSDGRGGWVSYCWLDGESNRGPSGDLRGRWNAVRHV